MTTDTTWERMREANRQIGAETDKLYSNGTGRMNEPDPPYSEQPAAATNNTLIHGVTREQILEAITLPGPPPSINQGSVGEGVTPPSTAVKPGTPQEPDRSASLAEALASGRTISALQLLGEDLAARINHNRN